MPSSTREPICTVLHLLYSTHTSPNSTYYHYTASLTAYSAWLVHLWLSFVKDKHASGTEKKSLTLYNTCTQLQFVQRQTLLALMLQGLVCHLVHLRENGLSQPIMQPPCGVLAAMHSVMYSGQNVQEGDLTRSEKTRKKNTTGNWSTTKCPRNFSVIKQTNSHLDCKFPEQTVQIYPLLHPPSSKMHFNYKHIQSEAPCTDWES